ncbi:phosphopantetheine-binding protein [Kitasatospora sp. NPDC057015]|uniref:phosphopantetheine-binding protein n=1 Tax=Kitasatospora sp. NPDC057015 TaxID=3346001 RepID=UPI003635CE2A
MSAALGRDEVVAMLAGFGDRTPQEVPEGIDSMELAWLVHQIEQRYDRHLDDDTLARMTTVSAVVEVLGGLGELRPDRA